MTRHPGPRSASQPGMTSWWWIRHAPVPHGGRLYGATDVPCDTSDAEAFAALARVLPATPRWVTSHLSRAVDTMRAIGAAGYTLPKNSEVEAAFGEQSFGDWHGLTHDEVRAQAPTESRGFWIAPALHRPPGGESFVELAARVHPAIQRLTNAYAGGDIVAVAHGGTIRAALGLALGLSPEAMLAFRIDNLSITRLDHFDLADGAGAWRVTLVNASPRLGVLSTQPLA